MKVNDVIKVLEGWAPHSLAEEWDNPGLQVGNKNQEVHGIFVALEVNASVLQEMVYRGCDLLITHHPFIFKPIKKVVADDYYGSRIMYMIQNNISCFAMHTNFDMCYAGMADWAAELIGLQAGRPLEEKGTIENESYGYGKYGYLTEAMTLKELCNFVKEQFMLDGVQVFGNLDETVTTVAICPGSGKDFIPNALKVGADVLITGDVGHHAGLDASEQGLAIIDATHYGLEKIFVPMVSGFLRKAFPDATIYNASDEAPSRFI